MDSVEINHDVIATEMARAALVNGHRIGRRVVDAAKHRCPVDEGTLRASIDYTVDVDTAHLTAHVTIGSPLPYAEYFHTGTGIYGPHGHRIVPVTAKALKFKWTPKFVGPIAQGDRSHSRGAVEKRPINFFASVAGMAANPFLVYGLQDAMGSIERLNPR